MNKYKIVVLCGEAASGKDTIKNQILEKYPDIFHRVITATTRPKREGEIDGRDYYFLLKRNFKNTDMIESCCFNNWYYGTPTTSLSKEKINLLVMNPSGIQKLLQQPDKYNVEIVRLIASDKERMLRQLNRETEPNVDEIVRRYTTDKQDFGVFDIAYCDKIRVSYNTEIFTLEEITEALATQCKYWFL